MSDLRPIHSSPTAAKVCKHCGEVCGRVHPGLALCFYGDTAGLLDESGMTDTPPSAEQIMIDAAKPITSGTAASAMAIVYAQSKALTDAGKIIVDKEPSEAQIEAGFQAFEAADYEGDWRKEFADVYRAMTQPKDTRAMVTTSDAEWYDPEEQDTGS